MVERNLKAFEAIVSFVKDLNEVFGSTTKATPISLYSRFVDHINPETHTEAMNKIVQGFETFFANNVGNLSEEKVGNIPRGTCIPYSEKVHLEIQKYLYKADPETRSVIITHLLTIFAILHPDGKVLKNLERRTKGLIDIDTTTNEGQFINDLMEKAKDSMQDTDLSNPGNAMMGLFQSGVFGELMSGLESGSKNGSIDMKKMMRTIRGALDSILPIDESDEEEDAE